jgi:hypothetical protein
MTGMGASMHMGGTGMRAMPGMMGMGGAVGFGGGGGGGGPSISEEEYVHVWESYSKATGAPFDADTVRMWYKQYQMSLER